MSIRLGASAVIVQNEKVLLVEFMDKHIGLHYNLPGGGVRDNETLHDAVRREVCEETCLTVDVGRVLFILEYISIQHENRYGDQHKVNVVFECIPHVGSEAQLPKIPDADEETCQVGVRWINFNDLPDVPLIPKIGIRIIEAISTTNREPYILNEAL